MAAVSKPLNLSRSPRAFAIVVASLFLATAAAGCVGGNEDDAEAVVIGIPGGWTGETLRSWMVYKVLTDELGYTVEAKPDMEAGLIYQGLGNSDIDVFVGAWLPLQQDHYDGVKTDVAILGNNLPGEAVSLNLAVPKYLADQGITSIADLEANAAMFDSTITGIESGAGMMMTAEQRMENWDVYGLGDWTLQASSTSAMLAAYGDAVANEEPIVVTIWKPHYAYAKWTGQEAMVDLEDPGFDVDGETKYFYKDQTEAANVQTLVPNDFEDRHPEAAAFLKKFQISGEDENNLMLKVNERSDEADIEKELAFQYLEDNPELVQSWLN